MFVTIFSVRLYIHVSTEMNATDSPSAPTNTTASADLYSIAAKIGLISAYIFIFTMALFGNSIGLYVACSKAPSRRITDLLIKNLAIADLIFTVTVMPDSVIFIIYEGPRWIGGTLGHITCKLVFYAVPVSIAASVITLTVISFDRFCAIFFPLSQALFHKHKTITAIIWLISLTTMAPNLLLFQVFQDGGRYSCYQVWPWAEDLEETFLALKIFHVIAFVLLYVLPLLIIAVVNSLVAQRVWFHKSPGNTASFNRTPVEVTRRRAVKMLVAIVIVFALCWLPTYVHHYLMLFQPVVWGEVPIVVGHLMLWVSHANSAINPLLYIVFNKNFRYAFLNATIALFASPIRAVSTCTACIMEERSTSDAAQQQNHLPPRPRQHAYGGFRVAPATWKPPKTPGARNGTGKTRETRL